MIEPRSLKLTEIDHEHYLKLVDVERLLHDMRRDIYDHAPYEKTEDGLKKYQLTDTEREVLNNLYFVTSCIKRRLVLACDSPDEIRELHERIRKGYYFGKYYLCQTDTDEDGKKTVLYFRKYCPGAMEARMEEEGATKEEIEEAMIEKDGDPAFTTEGKYAQLFESMEEAYSHRAYLNHNYNMNLDVCEAFLLDARACRSFLDKLLKGGDEDADRAKD